MNLLGYIPWYTAERGEDEYDMYVTENGTENGTAGGTGLPLMDAQPDCSYFNFYLAVVMAACAASCVIGNGLTLPTFARQSRRLGPTPTIFLFQAMAVADMMVLIPIVVVSVYPEICLVSTGLTGPCRTFHHRYLAWLVAYFWPLGAMGQVASVWMTVAVTYHRHRAVCTPFLVNNSATSPMTLAYVHVAAVWVFAVVYNLPRFWEHYVTSDVNELGETVYTFHHSDMFNNRLYQIIYKSVSFFLLIALIPLTIISVLTLRLVRALRRSEAVQRGLSASSPRAGRRRSRRERSLTITLIVVIIIFVLCQVPTTVGRVIIAAMGMPVCGDWLWVYMNVCNLLIMVNSSVNFYVYTSCSSAFRHHLRMLFTCGRGRCCCCRTTPGGDTGGWDTRYSRYRDTTRGQHGRGNSSSREAESGSSHRGCYDNRGLEERASGIKVTRGGAKVKAAGLPHPDSPRGSSDDKYPSEDIFVIANTDDLSDVLIVTRL